MFCGIVCGTIANTYSRDPRIRAIYCMFLKEQYKDSNYAKSWLDEWVREDIVEDMRDKSFMGWVKGKFYGTDWKKIAKGVRYEIVF